MAAGVEGLVPPRSSTSVAEPVVVGVPLAWIGAVAADFVAVSEGCRGRCAGLRGLVR